MRLSVDEARCTLCERCIPTCPTDMVRRKGDRIRIGRVACIECGHCIALCPEGAIVDEGAATLPAARPGEVTPAALRRLVEARRSTRDFRPEAPPREVIEEILDMARWTPTAANCQAQRFVVVASEGERTALRLAIEAHYREFAASIADREDRATLHPHILAAVPAFAKAVEAGRDRLFFGAPVVVVVHAGCDEVMPESAASFATMLLVLAAEVHGLASCITGYASDALELLPAARERLGIPPEHRVHQVVALGYGAERFLRIPDRRPDEARWV